jgi:acetolactate synthase-1/2/3 large subunit
VIFAGGGVILSKAAPELTELARKGQIPVTTSLMGLGAFPATDPLVAGNDRHARHVSGQHEHRPPATF